MSRSVKKFPVVKDKTCCKAGKRFANKRIRRYKGFISNGKEYKKLYDSWDICDYCFYLSEIDLKKSWEAAQKDLQNNVSNWHYGLFYKEASLEENLIKWKKTYLNK